MTMAMEVPYYFGWCRYDDLLGWIPMTLAELQALGQRA
jgi:hypothetical protein